MRWAPLAAILAGCLHPSSLTCPGPDGTSWVCPADLACAQPPTYCGTSQEVGACDGKAERDPCSTNLVPDGLCISGVCEVCSNDIAGCRYVGWLAMTSPTSSALRSIAFTGFGEAYAGDNNGTIFHYLNVRWEADSRFTYGTPSVEVKVAAAGDKVYALATANQVYALANNAWAPLAVQPTGAYKAIWAAASGDVFLVGPAGATTRWDGSTWTPSTAGGAPLSAVWGTSANDVYAAGTAGSLWHYNGAGWTSIANPGGAYAAVFGAGTDVFAAGGAIAHGDSSTFTATSSPVTPSVRGLWGSAADDMFAVGDNGVVLHWDGVAWTQMQASTSTLYAVAGSGAAEVFAVGDGGAISRYTGAAWAVESSPAATMPLLDVAAAGPDEALAVGGEGLFRFRAGVWTHELPTPAFTAVATRGPSDAIVVGTGVGQTYDGTWHVANGPFGVAGDVWPTQTSYVAVSDNLFEHTTSWANIGPAQPSSRGLWIAPSGRFWIAGTGVSHVDGTTLTTDISTGTYNAIWGAGEADVFAAGVGTIQHYDGSAWAAMTVPTTNSLAGIWGRAGDDVFAVGSSNAVLHYHAGLWQPFTTPFSGDLTSVSGAGSSIYMTAKDGKVHRLIDTAP